MDTESNNRKVLTLQGLEAFFNLQSNILKEAAVYEGNINKAWQLKNDLAKFLINVAGGTLVLFATVLNSKITDTYFIIGLTLLGLSIVTGVLFIYFYNKQIELKNKDSYLKFLQTNVHLYENHKIIFPYSDVSFEIAATKHAINKIEDLYKRRYLDKIFDGFWFNLLKNNNRIFKIILELKEFLVFDSQIYFFVAGIIFLILTLLINVPNL